MFTNFHLNRIQQNYTKRTILKLEHKIIHIKRQQLIVNNLIYFFEAIYNIGTILGLY